MEEGEKWSYVGGIKSQRNEKEFPGCVSIDGQGNVLSARQVDGTGLLFEAIVYLNYFEGIQNFGMGVFL